MTDQQPAKTLKQFITSRQVTRENIYSAFDEAFNSGLTRSWQSFERHVQLARKAAATPAQQGA
jgi:hypothetical protein